MTVHVGSQAPDFDLESDSGDRVSLADYAGRWLVLYFYPRDNTPGCTREAQDFSAAVARLGSLGAAVVGVSRDSVKSHCGFRDKIGIRFPLLSDPDLETHRAYGAWGAKTMYGRKVEGTIRSTFLLAPDGKVAAVWSGVKVDGHADKVLAAIGRSPDDTTPATRRVAKTTKTAKTAKTAKNVAAPAKAGAKKSARRPKKSTKKPARA
ncbi:MAG: peroxiredoxin [Polyangiaceae bacterium]|nr:peroxiredoxin [Polyangiaceae bacterium]